MFRTIRATNSPKFCIHMYVDRSQIQLREPKKHPYKLKEVTASWNNAGNNSTFLPIYMSSLSRYLQFLTTIVFCKLSDFINLGLSKFLLHLLENMVTEAPVSSLIGKVTPLTSGSCIIIIVDSGASLTILIKVNNCHFIHRTSYMYMLTSPQVRMHATCVRHAQLSDPTVLQLFYSKPVNSWAEFQGVLLSHIFSVFLYIATGSILLWLKQTSVRMKAPFATHATGLTNTRITWSFQSNLLNGNVLVDACNSLNCLFTISTLGNI